MGTQRRLRELGQDEGANGKRCNTNECEITKALSNGTPEESEEALRHRKGASGQNYKTHRTQV